jgi:2-hydroxy-3-oxopropionate reductase
MSHKIGFIGLGTMGMPVAKNILKKFGKLLVFDLIQEKKEELRKAGADAASDNIQIAKHCNVIFLSLLMPAIVEDVVARGGRAFETRTPWSVHHRHKHDSLWIERQTL